MKAEWTWPAFGQQDEGRMIKRSVDWSQLLIELQIPNNKASYLNRPGSSSSVPDEVNEYHDELIKQLYHDSFVTIKDWASYAYAHSITRTSKV